MFDNSKCHPQPFTPVLIYRSPHSVNKSISHRVTSVGFMPPKMEKKGVTFLVPLHVCADSYQIINLLT